MRVLELALLLAGAASVWLTAFPSHWNKYLIALGALIMVAHVLVEGVRWQMLPAYALIVLAAVFQMRPHGGPSGVWTSLANLALLMTAAGLSTGLPVFDFPATTGPFSVGTVSLHLTDNRRVETMMDHPRSPRELMVQIWYPAENAGKRARYIPSAVTRLKTAQMALVRTHATERAPFSRKGSRYPVVIFCPSWTGGKAQNTFQTEELASHGFVVVGMDHPYATNVTVFPDGRIIRSKLGAWLDTASEGSLQRSTGIAEDQLRIRSLDVQFVLSALQEFNRHDPHGLFEGRLDLDRLGIFGHSFGGAVATQVCWLDDRFRAGINMDGLLFGDSAEAGVRRPFFFMNSDTLVPEPGPEAEDSPLRRNVNLMRRDLLRIRHSLAEYGGYEMTISGASHMNFCDSPLYSPLKRFTSAGPIAVPRAMQIINRYTVAFFQQHLNGAPQALLDGASPEFPEARFRRWSSHAK